MKVVLLAEDVDRNAEALPLGNAGAEVVLLAEDVDRNGLPADIQSRGLVVLLAEDVDRNSQFLGRCVAV